VKRIGATSSALALLTIASAASCSLSTLDLNDFQDPLLNAARDGDVIAIEALLETGIDSDRSDAYGNTPLTIAAHFGQAEAAKFLLAHGAALEGTPDNTMTPLHCAVYSGHSEVAKLFLEKGADPDAPDNCGHTTLAIAANKGDASMVKLLLASHADIEKADALGWRPLHIALRSTVCSEADRLSTVAALLEHGADPNALNAGGYEQDGDHDSHVGWRPAILPNQGNTPLAIAVSNGFNKIVDLLKDHGAQ
jgi:ankyrin repeat protein